MSQSLSDRVVLVTGGAKRVGEAIVRELHRTGARLALHYNTGRAEAQSLQTELNALRAGSTITVQADLNDVAALSTLVQAVIAHFGRLDALVNNASTFYPTPMGEITERHWNDLMGVNARAPLFLSQAAAPYLKERGGCIVNITDIHAERPLQRYAVYSAAKAALLGVTRALAIELGPHIRVNAVAPGPVLWPENDAFDESARERIVSHTLLKRAGEPGDVARAVAFLVADAPYVTGQVIAVDGGRSINL